MKHSSTSAHVKLQKDKRLTVSMHNLGSAPDSAHFKGGNGQMTKGKVELAVSEESKHNFTKPDRC